MKGILFLLIVASLGAVTTSFDASVSEARDLVKVTGDLSFSNVISGHDYQRSLNVALNLPDDSLKGIVSDKVVVHVVAQSTGDNSWIYFREGEKSYSVIAFDLVCVVVDEKCGGNSTLSKEIIARMHAPLNANYPHSEKIVVNTDFTETNASQEIASYDDFTKAIKAVEEKAKQVPHAGEVLKVLDTAREKAASGNYSEAIKVVENARKSIE